MSTVFEWENYIKELTTEEVIANFNVVKDLQLDVYTYRDNGERNTNLGHITEITTHKDDPAIRTSDRGFYGFNKPYIIEHKGDIYMRGYNNSWLVPYRITTSECYKCIHICKQDEPCSLMETNT